MPEPRGGGTGARSRKAPQCGAPEVRPRGLEPPRTIKPTRRSTSIGRRGCFQWRPNRPDCEVLDVLDGLDAVDVVTRVVMLMPRRRESAALAA